MREKLKIGMSIFLVVLMLFSMVPAITSDKNNENPNVKGYDRKAELVYINGMEVDLAYGPEISKALQATAPGDSEPGYYIVQFDGPIEGEDRALLDREGVDVYGYIPNFAFLVRLTPQARGEIEENVTMGLYHPAYKISGSCFMDVEQKDEEDTTGDTPSNIYNILIFAGENVQEFKAEMKNNFGAKILSEAAMEKSHLLRMKLRPLYINEIAKMTEVMWIEKYVQPKIEKGPDIENYWATYLMQSGTTGTLPIYNQGVSGANQVVCVADTGLDYDHSMFYDYTN
ncbi:MAG: hypothetical protein U9N35_01030, partial [Euryarchaeota archaeon]|nr:hypothetical protein [Euryarchaeota archaeon]